MLRRSFERFIAAIFLAAPFPCLAIYAPFETSPSQTIVGYQSSDQFGSVLRSLGDVNSDGIDDIAVGAPNSSSGTGEVFVFVGSTSGLNSLPIFQIVGSAISQSAGIEISESADFNGDGLRDLAFSEFNSLSASGTVRVLSGNGAGGFSNVTTLAYPASSATSFGLRTKALDIDRDGASDLAITFNLNPCCNNYGAKIYSGSPGSLSNSNNSWIVSNTNFLNAIAAGGDINADGYPDIVLAPYGLPIICSLGSPSGPSSYFSIPSSGGNYQGVIFCNINGDPYSDLVIVSAPSNYKMETYLGNPNGILTKTNYSRFEGNSFGAMNQIVCLGDVSGDGYDDVAIGSFFGTSGKVRIFLSNGVDGFGEAAWIYIGGANENAMSVCTADIDGDAIKDLIVGAEGSPGPGRIHVFKGKGAATFQSGTSAPIALVKTAIGDEKQLCIFYPQKTMEAKWNIYNVAGERVRAKDFFSEKSHCVDVKSLASGFYFLVGEVIYSDGTKVIERSKIVIKK